MAEFISIRGARENNLKDVTLQIPKRKLTIFTGVSGSGKSSIVFGHVGDGGAAPALRELLVVHPQLPAEVPAARRRRDRKPHHGGDRRSEAARRWIAFHCRHSNRYPWGAAPAVLARRQTVRGRGDRLFVQRSAWRVSRVRGTREEGGRGLRRFSRPEQVAQ